ncbi:hypothetical protein EYC84_003597 [Monilinia fructicola]|uniref:Uncharacterized protein n=1 Tax=Monilinia fructicola TaxID=38448 RepID=A0A5M9JZC1_MONFR|nr:hypothetical protein EYC84_003597 [Monilinia fructicola]
MYLSSFSTEKWNGGGISSAGGIHSYISLINLSLLKKYFGHTITSTKHTPKMTPSVALDATGACSVSLSLLQNLPPPQTPSINLSQTSPRSSAPPPGSHPPT